MNNQELRNKIYSENVLLEVGMIGATFGSIFENGKVILKNGRRQASASQTLALLLIANKAILNKNYHRAGHSGYYMCNTAIGGTVCWYTRHGDIPYMYGMSEERAAELISKNFPEYAF